MSTEGAPERVAQLPTWLLAQAHQRAHGLLADAFARRGVRGYHYRLLAALEESGPASQAALGRRTGIDRSDVVAVVTELTDRALVTRSSDPLDRRRNTITITSAGTAFLTELDDDVAAVQVRLLSPLAPDERDELVRLLRCLSG